MNPLAFLLLCLAGWMNRNQQDVIEYPYHCNVAKHHRWRYVASGKVTPMYMDVFVFDQARYFYDLVPTLPLLVDRLQFPNEWILRACMDGIFRHTAHVCGEWFYASTLAESGIPGFKFHDLPKRETVKGDNTVSP